MNDPELEYAALIGGPVTEKRIAEVGLRNNKRLALWLEVARGYKKAVVSLKCLQTTASANLDERDAQLLAGWIAEHEATITKIDELDQEPKP